MEITKQHLVWGIVILVAVVLVGLFSWQKTLAPSPTDMATTTATSTGATTTGNVTKSTTSTKTTYPLHDTDGLTLITYTSTGFYPTIVQVKAGQGVRFRNVSNKALLVTPNANENDKTTYYQDLKQTKSLPKGGSVTINMNRIGAWGYKNLNYPSHTGVITVLP